MASLSTVLSLHVRIMYGLSFTVMSIFPADSLEGAVADAGLKQLLELVQCGTGHEVLPLFVILV